MNTLLEYCEDVDECFLHDHDCDQNSVCTNSIGSFACTCKTGYFGDGKTCIEGNCTEETCPINEECVSPTKSDCRCKRGYEREYWKAYGIEICVDTDECSSGICDENSVCVNSLGGYECNECQEGYFGNGKTCFRGFCSDSNCPPSDHKECVSPRSHECKCIDGYVFNNFSVCVDVDECVNSPCDRNANCFNNPGSFSCSCSTRYVGDGFSCLVDDCATGYHNCHINATCENFEGLFNCSCHTGFSGDGVSCSWKKTVLVLRAGVVSCACTK